MNDAHLLRGLDLIMHLVFGGRVMVLNGDYYTYVVGYGDDSFTLQDARGMSVLSSAVSELHHGLVPVARSHGMTTTELLESLIARETRTVLLNYDAYEHAARVLNSVESGLEFLDASLIQSLSAQLAAAGGD